MSAFAFCKASIRVVSSATCARSVESCDDSEPAAPGAPRRHESLEVRDLRLLAPDLDRGFLEDADQAVQLALRLFEPDRRVGEVSRGVDREQRRDLALRRVAPIDEAADLRRVRRERRHQLVVFGDDGGHVRRQRANVLGDEGGDTAVLLLHPAPRGVELLAKRIGAPGGCLREHRSAAGHVVAREPVRSGRNQHRVVARVAHAKRHGRLAAITA
jgi:hypothetical protein